MIGFYFRGYFHLRRQPEDGNLEVGQKKVGREGTNYSSCLRVLWFLPSMADDVFSQIQRADQE